MTFMNCVNVMLSGRVQAVCAAITTMSLIIIIIIGLIYVGKGKELYDIISLQRCETEVVW